MDNEYIDRHILGGMMFGSLVAVFLSYFFPFDKITGVIFFCTSTFLIGYVCIFHKERIKRTKSDTPKYEYTLKKY